MHDSEPAIDADLVRRLLRGQFPRWADLPVHRLASGGTVNAVYRLGDELTVRLPLTAGGADDIAWEARWLPFLAPALPVRVPTVVATGKPAEGYPWRWSVHEWLTGTTPVEGDVPDVLAHDLAALLDAMRDLDPAGGPPAYRGGLLAAVDAEMRAAMEALRHTDEPFDPAAIAASWAESLDAPQWTDTPRWLHSDLMPSNLLLEGGRLTAVLDWSTAGVGDPACDLIPAWNLLPPGARDTFREATGADDAAWLRGRGWALSMAVIQLPYYRTTNPVISANARHVISAVIGDGRDGPPTHTR